MDWNRWIREGIPYMKKDEEEKLYNTETKNEQKYPEGGFIYNYDRKKVRKYTLTDNDKNIVQNYIKDCIKWFTRTLEFIQSHDNSINMIENFLKSISSSSSSQSSSSSSTSSSTSSSSLSTSMHTKTYKNFDMQNLGTTDITSTKIPNEYDAPTLFYPNFFYRLPSINVHIRRAILDEFASYVLDESISKNFSKYSDIIDTSVDDSNNISIDYDITHKKAPKITDKLVKSDIISKNLALLFELNWKNDDFSGIYFTTHQHQQHVAQEQQIQQSITLKQKIGMRRIYKLMINSKVPLIGHNCLFDIMFMLESFDSILPSTLNEFTQLISTRFPYIFDTKILFTSSLYQLIDKNSYIISCHLEHLYKYFLHLNTNSKNINNTNIQEINNNCNILNELKSLKISLAPEFSYYTKVASSHEAAYDAYMTGYIFINILHLFTKYEHIKQDKKLKEFDDLKYDKNSLYIPGYIIKYLCNYIFSTSDINHLSISYNNNNTKDTNTRNNNDISVKQECDTSNIELHEQNYTVNIPQSDPQSINKTHALILLLQDYQGQMIQQIDDTDIQLILDYFRQLDCIIRQAARNKYYIILPMNHTVINFLNVPSTWKIMTVDEYCNTYGQNYQTMDTKVINIEQQL